MNIFERKGEKKLFELMLYVVLFVIFEKWYEEDRIINFWYRLI